MSLFENFPYTNLHDLNLDWIISKIKELSDKIDQAALGKITMADPFQWSIATNYPAYTLVEDADHVYISSQPVPAGISISDTDYWVPVFDLTQIFTELKSAISFSDDGNNPVSSVARYENELVWLNDELYKVTQPISQGEAYVVNTNIQLVSVETWVRSYVLALVNNIAQQITTMQSQLDEISELMDPERKILVIADSYGMVHPTTFLSVLISKMPNNYRGVAMSGYGFTNGTFETEFDDYIPQLPASFSPEKITDVVFCGGWNDAREIWAGRQNVNTLITAITSTFEHVHSVCPNAKIYTCFMAWHSVNSVQNQVDLTSILGAISAYGSIYLPYGGALMDAQYVLRDSTLLDNTLFHPSELAAGFLALALHNSIMTGHYNFTNEHTFVPAYLTDPGVTTSDFRMYVSIQNGITKIKSVPFAVSGSMVSNLVCKFNPQYVPVVMPDATRPLYMTGWFKGTADGVTYNYIYAMPILYANGDLKMFINGAVATNVQGTLLIDSTVDNTQIR